MDIANLATLSPLYGHNKAQEIVKYLADFQQYKDNFPPQKAELRQSSGQTLLLVTCPVTVQHSRGAEQIRIGVLFTHHFPEKPPHCALLLTPNDTIVEGHTVVAPNGAVRLVQLPFLAGIESPSLCDILLAVTESFETNFPLVAKAAPPPPPPASKVQPPSSAGNRSTLRDASSPVATAPVAERIIPPERKALEQKATETALLALKMKGEEYLQQRDAGLRHLQHLEVSYRTLNDLCNSLEEKRQTLLAIGPEMSHVSGLIKNWKESGELSNTDGCIVPVNDAHEQALDLLAEVHAIDDGLDLLEKCLRRGTVSADDYLIRVSELARIQFAHKYLLQKACAQIAGDSTARELIKQFPNLDPTMISEILRQCEYDQIRATQQLTELGR